MSFEKCPGCGHNYFGGTSGSYPNENGFCHWCIEEGVYDAESLYISRNGSEEISPPSISGELECKTCEHRVWEDGDRDYSPPGYGVYFCDKMVTAPNVISEQHMKSGRPSNCPYPVQTQLELFEKE